MRKRRTMWPCPALVVALATMVATTAPAQADPQSPLGQTVIAARSASTCGPLQSDPLVERVASMANQSTSDYMSHRSAAVPFTDPLPALSTLGYVGAKAVQFSGYGATQSDAVHALMLQWQASRPDCSYTQFGTSTWHDAAGFELASVILTTPAR